MAEMKFKFTIQPYQTEAVDSVAGVFAGQPFNDHFTYRRDVEIQRDVTNWMLSDEELSMGFANAKVQLDSGQLLENIHRIQARNNIKLSNSLKSGGLGVCSLDVEMETGTGKTYVYIKTMFELNNCMAGVSSLSLFRVLRFVRAFRRASKPCGSTSRRIMARLFDHLCITPKSCRISIITARVQTSTS